MKKFDVNLLRADLYRLRKQKSVWIALGVMAGVALLLSAIFAIGLAALSALPQDDVAASQIEMEMMRDSFYMLYKQLLFGFSDTALVTTMLIIVISLFVGSDFATRRITMLVGRGADRTHIYISHSIVIVIVTAAYTMFALLIGGICFAIFGSGNISFDAHDFGILMRDFALQLLSNISYASITLMLVYLLRSSGGALGAMLGITYGLSMIFSIVFMFASRNINTDWIMYMPLQQTDVAAVGTKMSDLQICAATIMPVFYTALSTFVGMFTFAKRDLK